MSLALLFHYLMLNMFRTLIHPSSGACDSSVESPHGLYRSVSMCAGATLWPGWGAVASVCGLQPAYGCRSSYFFYSFQTAWGPTKSPAQWIRGEKQAERGTNHWVLYSSEVKKDGMYKYATFPNTRTPVWRGFVALHFDS